MSIVRISLCTLLLVLVSTTNTYANQATRVSVCISIDRSGQLVGAQVTHSDVKIIEQIVLKAIRRAAPFPPLPEGSPPVKDFHYDVVCSCTGLLMNSQMDLCELAHDHCR